MTTNPPPKARHMVNIPQQQHGSTCHMYVYCNFIFHIPMSNVLILKSIPMVEINEELNVLSANRKIMHVFPTPLSPIRSNLKK